MAKETKLPNAQQTAVDLIEFIGGDGVERGALRDNGVRWDVIERLCRAKLAYCTGEGFGRDQTRVHLTAAGHERTRYAQEPNQPVEEGSR